MRLLPAGIRSSVIGRPENGWWLSVRFRKSGSFRGVDGVELFIGATASQRGCPAHLSSVAFLLRFLSSPNTPMFHDKKRPYLRQKRPCPTPKAPGPRQKRTHSLSSAPCAPVQPRQARPTWQTHSHHPGSLIRTEVRRLSRISDCALPVSALPLPSEGCSRYKAQHWIGYRGTSMCADLRFKTQHWASMGKDEQGWTQSRPPSQLRLEPQLWTSASLIILWY